MLARAPVTMTAGANFVVEAAIYFVLFGTEDGSEVAGEKKVRDILGEMGDGSEDAYLAIVLLVRSV